MKNLVILALVLMVSGKVFAAEGTGDYGSVNQGSGSDSLTSDIELNGRDAEQLINALQGAGSFFDSAMGHVGTVVQTVSCSRIKHEKNSDRCTLTVQDENGDQVKRILKGKVAKNLLTVLIDVDAAGCGMEGCTGEVKAISCEQRIAAEEDGLDLAPNCSISQ